MSDMKWPHYIEGQRYVRDRIGVIWLLTTVDNVTVALTVSAKCQITSTGLETLRNKRGPLYVLRKDNKHIWEHCEIIYGDCDDHDWRPVQGDVYLLQEEKCIKCERYRGALSAR